MKNTFLKSVIISLLFLMTGKVSGQTFGTNLGNFNGVIVYHNPLGYASGQYNSMNGTTTGMKWQCVEYINRYYLQVYNMNIRAGGGHAYQYFNSAASRGLEAYSNGGSVVPQVGDVLCFSGGKKGYGHVGIIKTVTPTQVTIVHQNGGPNALNFPISRSGNTLSGSSLGSTYTVQGWLRKPVTGTTINIIGNINAVSYPTSNGANILVQGQQKNISFTLKNITNQTVSRSFKLFLTQNGQVIGEVWNKNITFTPNQTLTFDRNNEPTLASAVSGAPGFYELILKGDVGSISNISINSFTIACSSGNCNPRVIQIIGSASNNFNINASSNSINEGSVSGSGVYSNGQSCTVSAIPEFGYSFLNWKENGNIVSTNPNYSFTVNGNRNLVAYFYTQQANTCVTCPNYNFTLTNNGSWGTHSSSVVSQGCKIYRILATPGRTYSFKTGCGNGATSDFDTFLELMNDSCTLISTDDDGCESNRSDIEWTCDYSSPNWIYVRVKGYSSEYGNYTLAYREITPTSNYTITLSSNPTAGGTTTGAGTFASGSSRTVTATANSGYTFKNWTENGSVVTTSNPYTFTLTGNRNLVADFSQWLSCPSYNFSPSNNSNWNTHSSAIGIAENRIYRFLAVPGRVYTFKTGCGNGATADFNTVLQLLDSNCNLITANDNGCEQQRSTIEWTCNYSTTGWVYLIVRGFNINSNFGNYTLAFRETTGLGTIELDSENFEVSPNPFDRFLKIKSKNSVINEIKLLDFSGKQIMAEKINNSKEYTLNTEGITQGVYMLKITTNNGDKTVKIIKK